MPPGPTAPCSLAGLLAVFRPCFTAPTFPTFVGLVVGLIAQTRRRTVCGMLTGAGLDQVWHHSRAHRMFSNARWSGDALGLVLADLIVARLLPADSALTIAVDDTLFKRSGKKVFGVAWHHDGAAKGPKPIGFGNCWVVAGIVVQLSFLSRPVCLPVLARLWRPRHTGKIAHARELAELIAARYPDRTVHVVGDVGAENPVMSCDLHVLVDEAAEPVSSQRPDGRSGARRSAARGRALMQRSVRTVRVVMLRRTRAALRRGGVVR